MDQTLFLSQFAQACNAVWEDERSGVPLAQRRCFNFLLMGQGGSCKTAIVQEIVLLAVEFFCQPEEVGQSPSLTVSLETA